MSSRELEIWTSILLLVVMISIVAVGVSSDLTSLQRRVGQLEQQQCK